MPHRSPEPRRTLLPRYLCAAYALLIIYASLEPFSGWSAPARWIPSFLWTAQPRDTLSDIVINIVAYLPLGFVVVLLPRPSVRPTAAFAIAVVSATALSFAMEWTQMFLPSRVSSNLDLLSNSAGAALGTWPALMLRRRPRWRRQLLVWRERIFVGGWEGDLGLVLIFVWLLAQVNPAIPLFASTFDPVVRPVFDAATVALESAQALLNVVGVGLFVGLLLRRRADAPVGVILFICLSLLVKMIAAALLLKPNFWQGWMGVGSVLGLIGGGMLLSRLLAASRRTQSLVCSVALLSAMAATLFAPDLLLLNAPLAKFSWTYGQLLNFNGLTHAVLVTWPFAASLYLFALAGHQPDIDPAEPTTARV